MQEADWEISLSDGYYFDPIIMWTDHTTWVDGRLRNADGEMISYLDIGCIAHKFDVPEHLVEPAAAAWNAGDVYSWFPYRDTEDPVIALLVPTQALNTELITEALRRFWR